MEGKKRGRSRRNKKGGVRDGKGGREEWKWKWTRAIEVE